MSREGSYRSIEMWDIEREVRRRAAVASGDPRGADAVPEPRRRGLRRDVGVGLSHHLESVIGRGAPPTSLLRRIPLGKVRPHLPMASAVMSSASTSAW